MKSLFRIILLVLAFSALGKSALGKEAPVNCRVVTLHCDCTNPQRKFTIENQRVGKVNPGDPGVCQSSVYIDEWLKQNRYTACVRGGQEDFDPAKPPACDVTWSCKTPCP